MTYWYMHRTLCDVLEDMRKFDEIKNYSIMKPLIEEAQVMANRMEEALTTTKELGKMRDEHRNLRKEIYALRKEKDALKGKKEDDD